MNLGDDANRLAAQARARVLIDRQRTDAGWSVQDSRSLTLFAAQGVARREATMATGHGRWPHRVRRWPSDGPDRARHANFLADSVRTERGHTSLTCANAPIHTLKRNCDRGVQGRAHTSSSQVSGLILAQNPRGLPLDDRLVCPICAPEKGHNSPDPLTTSPHLAGGRWVKGRACSIAERREAPLRHRSLTRHSSVRGSGLLLVRRTGCARTARQRRPQRGPPGARRRSRRLEPVGKVVTDPEPGPCASSADVRHASVS